MSPERASSTTLSATSSSDWSTPFPFPAFRAKARRRASRQGFSFLLPPNGLPDCPFAQVILRGSPKSLMLKYYCARQLVPLQQGPKHLWPQTIEPLKLRFPLSVQWLPASVDLAAQLAKRVRPSCTQKAIASGLVQVVNKRLHALGELRSRHCSCVKRCSGGRPCCRSPSGL